MEQCWNSILFVELKKKKTERQSFESQYAQNITFFSVSLSQHTKTLHKKTMFLANNFSLVSTVYFRFILCPISRSIRKTNRRIRHTHKMHFNNFTTISISCKNRFFAAQKPPLPWIFRLSVQLLSFRSTTKTAFSIIQNCHRRKEL